MADGERERRMTEAKNLEVTDLTVRTALGIMTLNLLSFRCSKDEVAIVRQINIEYTISAAEEEQERRVREYEVAKVHEQMLREQNKKQAIEAAEAERDRRVQELEDIENLSLEERAEQQLLAVQVIQCYPFSRCDTI